jgi:phosphoglycerate kinase
MLEQHGNLELPVDYFAAGPGVELHTDGTEPSEGDEIEVFEGRVPEGWRGFDIGPASAARFRSAIRAARTVLWNGPMGVFEDPRFAAGTRAVAEAMVASSAHTVIGGGDSAAAVRSLGLADRIDHISTGGGAALALLEHGDLPGLKALRHAVGFVRSRLGEALGTRKVPELRFELDDSLARSQRIEEILRDLGPEGGP